MRFMLRIFIVFLIVFFAKASSAQITASDCDDAVNICTDANFAITPSGSGNEIDFVTGSVSNPSTNPASTNSGCLLSGELNSTFMVINVATSGTLEFSFGDPNAGSFNCFDWIMWPYNPNACDGIQNNTLAPIRCNWNGNCMGFTGIAGTLPAGGDALNFEPPVNVLAGQQYLVCLSNFSSATTNVPLSFFGTAQVSCNPTGFVNNDTICAGDTAVLIAHGGLSYSWSPATNLSSTTNDTVFATPPATTFYVVTINGANGTITDTAWVVVDNSQPVVTVTANPNAICAGQSTTLTASGGLSYTWSPAIGLSATTGATVTASPPNTMSYTVVGTGTCTTDTTTINIAVNPIPLANAGPDVAICGGTTAQLNASGGTVYFWTPGAGLSDVNIANPIASPVATTTYTVQVTANGCTDTDDVTVSVVTQFDATITPVNPICIDLPAFNLAAASPGGTWSGTGITDPLLGTFNPATAGAGTHLITYMIAGNCGDTATTSITVNPVPVVSFSVDAASGCAPHAFSLTNTTAGATQCEIAFNGTVVSTSCGPYSTSLNIPGCYDVSWTVTDNNGCSASLTQPAMVCVFEQPVAAFSFAPTNATVLAPVVIFNNQSTGADAYLWDFDGQGTSVATNPSFTFPDTASGSYNVCLYAFNADGCADSICQTVTIYDDLLIYAPNAFTPDGDGKNEIFFPILAGYEPNTYELYIFNRWGELIFNSTTPGQGWDGKYKGQNIPNDVYVWKIKAKRLSSGETVEKYGHITLIR
jgi:gliding motility-associated-like protein